MASKEPNMFTDPVGYAAYQKKKSDECPCRKATRGVTTYVIQAQSWSEWPTFYKPCHGCGNNDIHKGSYEVVWCEGVEVKQDGSFDVSDAKTLCCGERCSECLRDIMRRDPLTTFDQKRRYGLISYDWKSEAEYNEAHAKAVKTPLPKLPK